MQHLILLHGAIGSSSTFNTLSALLKDNFIVHTPDFPGHGDDTSIEQQYAIQQFGDYVIQYMDKNHIESASVFGYSLGGYVGLELASRLPDRISKVFTFATIFNWIPENAEKQSRFLDPEKIRTKVPVFADQLSVQHGNEKWELVLKKTAAMLNELGDSPTITAEVFKNILQPVRISVGDRDQMVSLEESIMAYRSLSSASFSVFANTAHPFEKLDLSMISKEIIQFMD